ALPIWLVDGRLPRRCSDREHPRRSHREPSDHPAQRRSPLGVGQPGGPRPRRSPRPASRRSGEPRRTARGPVLPPPPRRHGVDGRHQRRLLRPPVPCDAYVAAEISTVTNELTVCDDRIVFDIAEGAPSTTATPNTAERPS